MFIIVGITVGDSLFLTNVAQEKVGSLYAWMHVGIAVVTVVVTWMYDRVMGLLSRIALLIGMQFILLLSILAFRQVIPSDDAQASEWLYFGLVIWLRVCGRLLIMLFFSFAGDYFSAHDARRLYGYIAGGLAVGIMVAGRIVDQVVPVIGTENMLYICMGFLSMGIGFSLFIYKIGTPVAQLKSSPDTETKVKAPLSAIFSQSYILLVFLVVLIGMMCFVIVDFQMKVSTKISYPNSMELAAFFGDYYTYVGMMAILFQFLAVEFLLRQFGIINCLMILPGIHMVMSVLFYSTGYGLFVGHTLFIIAIASFFQDTLSGSLDLPSRELLFLPLPSPVRVRAQAMMGGMIMPLAQGIGGLLIISLTTFGMPLFQFSLLVLFFAIVRVAILFWERPRYQDTLISSLKNNQLDAIELKDMVQASSIDFVLEELLKSDEEQVVSFTLGLLRDRSLGGLSTQLRKLAIDSGPAIAAKTLELLGADGDTGHLDTLERALLSTSDAVREAAVLAFCRIRKEKSLERVRQWLDVPDQVVRSAALVGCGRYYGQAGGKLTQPILKQMVSSPSLEERRTAARLLRDMRNPANAFLVESLLDDPDINVRIMAVEVCGAIQVPDLVPHLLQLYRSPGMRAYALNALEQMPEESVPLISEAAHDLTLDGASRNMLLLALASIGGRSAQKALWKFFSGEFPVVIRVTAGNALRRIATYGQLQEVNETGLEARLRLLCEEIELLNQGCKEIGISDEFSWQLMNDHARLEIDCLFQLLALKYNAGQVEKVRYNFFSSSVMQRANALELLDDILPRRIAPGIIQLLDSFVKGKTPDGRGLSEDIAEQLMRKETWLRVVTVYHLSGGTSVPRMQAGKSLTESEIVLYRLLGRISFLKKVPLFKDVPGNYLVPLAKIAHLVNLKSEEMLFHQGDRGDSMYLICRGSISILVNDVKVNRLEVGDCIGEMSLLDGAPRSASCVATEDAELLRILDSDFETIVKSQTSVALAVLQTLAGRLRQRTAKPVKQEGTGDAYHHKEKDASQQFAEFPLEGPVLSGVEGGRGMFLKQETKPEVVTDHPGGKTFGPETQAGELLTGSEKDLYKFFERISFLKKVFLFKEISENYLVPLAKIAHSVKLKDGETLFHQGDRGDAMYLIRFGSISVQVNGVEVNRMGVGECIGEMALLDDTPRSASCIAEEDTELLGISANDFETVVKSQTSVVFAMLRTLAGRLRQQTANSTQKQE